MAFTRMGVEVIWPVSKVPVMGISNVLTVLRPPAPGLPVPGLPVPGLPVPGLPVPGLPAPGLPVPGLPVPGLPVPGLPAPGLPPPGLLVLGPDILGTVPKGPRAEGWLGIATLSTVGAGGLIAVAGTTGPGSAAADVAMSSRLISVNSVGKRITTVPGTA